MSFLGGTRMYDSLVQHTEQGVHLLTTCWIPQKPWVAVLAGAACWYGRRVALTYVPGLLANYFIHMTVIFTGSVTIGKVVGATVVAPMLTPSLVPWAATIIGFGLLYLVATICNIFNKYVLNRQKTKLI